MLDGMHPRRTIPGASNVIRLDDWVHARKRMDSAVSRPLLTAVAGLDALRCELLGLSYPEGTSSSMMLQARAAAVASRQRLCRAHPILAAVEPLEILHLVASLEGAASSKPSRAISVVPQASSRMVFESMGARRNRVDTWRKAFVFLLASANCLMAAAHLYL